VKVATGAVIIAAPSFGPAVISIFGTNVPVLALGLSIAALLLARWVAPPPLRRLSKEQQIALTLLLLIFLFLAVTGNMPLVGDGHPLGVGMAVVWGAGLGFSGLFAVELMGARVRAMLRAALGLKEEDERV
jgi:ABC-type Co2+ transport system permease subunit